jgi:spermidine synthase
VQLPGAHRSPPRPPRAAWFLARFPSAWADCAPCACVLCAAAQEMIANLPLCAHRQPRRVVVIGGGDGGVIREIMRHPSVERVDHCEIDRRVCEVAMEYLPAIASELQRPEVRTHYEDGALFLKEHPGSFDVIIVDSSDPIGPAASLFEAAFYEIARDALREGGVLCTQAECLWNNLSLITELYADCTPLFQQCEYAYTTVPTYPSGQIGFMVCRNGPEPVTEAIRDHPAAEELRYYTRSLHEAAFVLPKFATDAMQRQRPKL